MAKQSYEVRSFRNSLSTFLVARGWTDVVFKEGFGQDETIQAPLVAITEMPLREQEFQLGRNVVTEKVFLRVFQVDAYMERESRASAIADDISDFMDEISVPVMSPDNTQIGYMLCDTETIRIENVPPNLTNPKVIRWRSITRGTYEVVYL